ncbi:hypothetical protein [Planktothrix agardhii]|uniref:hypothetical protein n=1 Tax=Planktothrix agardhii TaxID=1160 RepID=UPI000425BCBA|nr:hypothetical protein [Planktothrix agardhii]
MRILVKATTFFKSQPVDSSTLAENQKIQVPPGSSFVLETYSGKELNNHCLIDLGIMLGSGEIRSNSWYVYKPHTEILLCHGDVTINHVVELRNTPVISSDNVITKLGGGTFVELLNFTMKSDGLWWYIKAISCNNATIKNSPQGWMHSDHVSPSA